MSQAYLRPSSARNCMQPEKPSKRQLRSKSGVAELDEMFGGGQEAGTTTLVLIF
ncbi:hypothetical protein [Rhizobium nepotum]|uniref:hypothetical protein n=1 Tax=Rhizobium nepotum TaxID=1035271 RepID=UPI001364BC64|nr:hypothetical protein [Rhizobium nepotum]